MICLHICQHPCQMFTTTTTTHKPHHLFHIPNFKPVTYVREVQSPVVSKVPETEVNQYVTQEVQDENKQQQCPAQTDTVLQDRKCQKVKSAYMWPQKPKSRALQTRKMSNQVKERGSNCYATTQASNKGEKARSSNP